MKGTLSKLITVALGLAVILGIAWGYSRIGGDSGDFQNNLWGPTYLLTHGQSPYNIKVLFSEKNAVWLPMLVGVAFPLGWLPKEQAVNLWLFLSVAVTFWIIWISAGTVKPSPLSFTLAVLATLLFPPVVSHFVLGQFSIFVVALLVWFVRRKDKPPAWLAFFLLALALTKPQLCILAIPGIFIAYSKRKGLKTLPGLLLGIMAGMLVLTIPLFVGYPNWIKDFLANLRGYENWLQPTLFSMFRVWWGTPGLIMWGIAACSVFAINFWLWRCLPIEEALAWSLALTILITPFGWSWDFVLFIPLLAKSIYRIKTGWEAALLTLGYATCWIIMVMGKLSSSASDEQNWWAPCFLIGIFLICWILNGRAKANLPTFKHNSAPETPAGIR
jgi:hypothetical protein